MGLTKVTSLNIVVYQKLTDATLEEGFCLHLEREVPLYILCVHLCTFVDKLGGGEGVEVMLP